MTAWYRAGTVTATNGSATVTGALTAFLSNVKIGDAFCPDADGRGYEVTAVNSNTGIEIFPLYAGSTGSGKSYGISRCSPNWNSVSEIAVSLADILSAQSNILAGSGVPSDSLGADGDVYFRQDVAQYYTKGSGTWTLVTSLVGPAGPAGPALQGTSTTSKLMATGSWTLTTQSGLGFQADMRVRASNGANYMEGLVTSYIGTTLIINVTRVVGSGTWAAWNINVTGDVGPANSLAIGTVTTGAAGSSASASVTGTAPSQTLNLTIPRGNTGVQGDPGAQGAPGAAATIAVGTVTTLTAGSSATVANAGTSSAAVFNFGIPRGADGADGADGSLFATTSTTSTTLSTGPGKVFAVSTGLSFLPGNRVRIASAANPTTNWASAVVTGYSGSDLTVTIDLLGPAPVSAADWNIALTGEKGDQGPAGTLGELVPNKGNIPTGDGITFGVLTPGANGALHVADSAQPYGFASRLVDDVLAGAFWSTASVASAGTCDIGAASNPFVLITGTTTITSFGTSPNRLRFVRFDGALTLTYNGTSLVLPAARNIITRAGDYGIFASDASGNWRCVGWTPVGYLPRETLTADRTYYVRTDGNDANDGRSNSSGGAFLTIQKAINTVAALDLSTFNVTIQLGPGTYASFTVSSAWIGSGTVLVTGDTGTPSNVTISGVNAITCQNSGSRISISGMTISGSAVGLYAFDGQINCYAGLVFAGNPSGAHMRTNGQGSAIVFYANYTIASGGLRHYMAGPGGVINCTGRAVTLTGTPAFSVFAFADRLGVITALTSSYAGAATGKRYEVASNAGVFTGAGGASFFPGDVAGTTATGGQYL